MTAQAEFATVIRAIDEEARGVKSFALERADGADFPHWTPGAHIDIALQEGLNRQYSLCGDPQDHRSLRFAVLREEQSRGGSAMLHDTAKVGDALPVLSLRNNFPLVDADLYRMIAGGIGITPILAMIRELEASGKDWQLLYGGRSRASMAFLEELGTYGDKVQVCPQDEAGLLDIAGFLGPDQVRTVAYCCGPEPLIKAVEDHCREWPEDSLQIERFHPREQEAPAGGDSSFEVELRKSGKVITVSPDVSIAEALEEVGVVIPRSCNEGTCGTCITKVVEGIPDHRDSFLRPKKRAENKRIMVCCSRSLSPRIVLDV